MVAIASIADPVPRNHAINQSYHAFGREMAKYLGAPLVSNWCTYGQHASREAGQQINNLQAGLKILADAIPILTGLATPTNPLGFSRALLRVQPTLRRVFALLNEDGLMRQSLQLALAKAGITQGEIDGLINAFHESATMEWSDLIPGQRIAEDVELAGRAVALAIKLGIGLPAVIRAVQKVFNNMVQGNREIYENIAPAYAHYLRAALRATNGAVDPSGLPFARDTGGFVAAAFGKYSEARAVAVRIAAGGGAASLIAQRNALVHEANLLIGYQEQLVILQPIFDTMLPELASMDGTMVIRDPNGTHQLTNGWGNFYTRMGLRSAGFPANPAAIRARRLPTLHPTGSPGAKGTISAYFERYLADRRIHQAPPAIAPH